MQKTNISNPYEVMEKVKWGFNLAILVVIAINFALMLSTIFIQ